MNTTHPDKLNLSVKEWKIKLETRSRGRMKLTIKLSREEAEGFTAFQKTVCPENMSQDEFLRSMFFLGMQAANQHLAQAAQEYMEAHPEKFDASGNVTEESEPKFEIVEGNDDNSSE